jgi:hypothetical protein
MEGGASTPPFSQISAQRYQLSIRTWMTQDETGGMSCNMIENAYYNWPFFLFFSRCRQVRKDKAHWNKEGVDLNLNDFYLSKESASTCKAANFNGRPILRLQNFGIIF